MKNMIKVVIKMNTAANESINLDSEFVAFDLADQQIMLDLIEVLKEGFKSADGRYVVTVDSVNVFDFRIIAAVKEDDKRYLRRKALADVIQKYSKKVDMALPVWSRWTWDQLYAASC